MNGALAGQVAIVTGASRGIGEAIARRFAHEGAHVAAVARTLEPSDSRPGSLRQTVDAITAAGAKAFAVQADLSVAGDRARLIAEVEERAGAADILVNNAAVTWLTPIAEFGQKRYDLMFELQVKAPVALAQLVLPGMRARRRGWILNISSLAARNPSGPPYTETDITGNTVYGMCKAALERFSTGLAAEMYGEGIAVNSLAPARIVATWGTLHHHLIPHDKPDEIEYPPEFAEAALALCSADPKVRTGICALSSEIIERYVPLIRDVDGTPFTRPEPPEPRRREIGDPV